MVANASKYNKVNGRVVASSKMLDDWDDEDCLCMGVVPEEKRIDVQQRIYDEKRDKYRWKSLVRYHQDCPIHGLERSV